MADLIPIDISIAPSSSLRTAGLNPSLVEAETQNRLTKLLPASHIKEPGHQF